MCCVCGIPWWLPFQLHGRVSCTKVISLRDGFTRGVSLCGHVGACQGAIAQWRLHPQPQTPSAVSRSGCRRIDSICTKDGHLRCLGLGRLKNDKNKEKGVSVDLENFFNTVIKHHLPNLKSLDTPFHWGSIQGVTTPIANLAAPCEAAWPRDRRWSGSVRSVWSTSANSCSLWIDHTAGPVGPQGRLVAGSTYTPNGLITFPPRIPMGPRQGHTIQRCCGLWVLEVARESGEGGGSSQRIGRSVSSLSSSSLSYNSAIVSLHTPSHTSHLQKNFQDWVRGELREGGWLSEVGS